MNPLLWIAGYSFPPADMFFSLHITNAFQSRSHPDRAIILFTPKKEPKREVEFGQRAFDAFLQDTETWASTTIEWSRGAEIMW